MRSLLRILSLLSLAKMIGRGDVRGLATRPLRRRGHRLVRRVK